MTYDWRKDAACATHPHPEWWTAEANEHTTKDEAAEQLEAAAWVCTDCPVRAYCRRDAEAGRTAYAETVRPFGVLAGRFYDGSRRVGVDLVRMLRLRTMAAANVPDKVIADELDMTHAAVVSARRSAGIRYGPMANAKPLSPTFEHGTRNGYACHRRRGEEPCQACKDGKRRDDRVRWAKLRATRKAAA